MIKIQPHQQYNLDPISTDDIKDHPNDPDTLLYQHPTMLQKYLQLNIQHSLQKATCDHLFFLGVTVLSTKSKDRHSKSYK